MSPFARKNYVSHTTADYTAILKLIESRFKLPSLTNRDAAQVDANGNAMMLEFFDFTAVPWATPPSKHSVAEHRRGLRLHEAAIIEITQPVIGFKNDRVPQQLKPVSIQTEECGRRPAPPIFVIPSSRLKPSLYWLAGAELMMMEFVV